MKNLLAAFALASLPLLASADVAIEEPRRKPTPLLWLAPVGAVIAVGLVVHRRRRARLEP